jgi:hypothetical protein
MPNVNPWDYAEKSGLEHAHQTALMMWANMATRFGLTAADEKTSYTVTGVAMALRDARGDLVHQLKWLHAIHNQGHGDKVRGAMAKAEGVKAGVFDLFLPVPKYDANLNGGWYHGFYLELKVGDNKPSAIQLEFKSDMEEKGYYCDIAWGWLEARKKLLDYLGFKG